MARNPKKRKRESTFSGVDEFGYISLEDNGASIKNTSQKENLNRAYQVRRDTDTVQDFEITLQTIDNSFLSFIENTIKPYVEENGERINVPVIYGSPEKWSSIQKNGFLRDKKGKLIIPLIVFRRTGIANRDELTHNKVYYGPDNKIQFEKGYSKQNKYDQFSVLQGRKPVKEFYEINIPDYVDVSYEMTIWCEYTSQVNKLVETMVFWSGKAWGDSYKFITKADSYSFETTNDSGDDRLNRATVGFTVKGHLIPKEAGSQTNVKKTFSKAQIVIDEKTTDDISNV